MQPMYWRSARCSQAEDQLLREGRQWPDSCRRIDFRHTSGAGPLDAIASAAVERGDGSDDVHGLDLRLSPPTCSRAEGGASADAAGHCRREKEERPHRRQQDLRLLTVRFFCRRATKWLVDGDSRTAAHVARRNLLVRQMVQMKIKISALLMEAGVSYNKQRLHKCPGYFRELLATNPDIDEGLCSPLRLCRETVVRLGKNESALVSLERDSLLVERIERLMTIPAGRDLITALTWALEVGDVSAILCRSKAISYCGLCGVEKSSGNTVQRTPLSKQRNKAFLQTTLIEAAKMAPTQ